MQERVFSTEAVMLRAFGFVLHVEHPHKFVLSLLLLLGLDGPILQEAWNLTNDRYKIQFAVLHQPTHCGINTCTIACWLHCSHDVGCLQSLLKFLNADLLAFDVCGTRTWRP